MMSILSKFCKSKIMSNSTYRSIIVVLVITAFLLLIPLVAMLFSDEVGWSLGDFIMAGMLLISMGLIYILIARRLNINTYRWGVGLAILTSLILIWLNLAVGLIGSEDNPANVLYGFVLLIGFGGSIISQFKPRGMSYAMFATAFAQALVPVFAFLIWRPSTDSPEAIFGIIGVFILNGFFVILFIGSALLFKNAARKEMGR